MQMGSQYEQQLVQVETQLNVVSSLGEYVNDPTNQNKTIPTNVGLDDPSLAATTSEYNRLVLERERLSQSMTDDNPAMVRMDEQIRGLRQNINSSIRSVQQGLNIQRRDARNQANIYGGRIGSMPTQEREFMELSREQQIKASLFLMLLQKREENALQLAATANSAKVLDEAILDKAVSRVLRSKFTMGLFEKPFTGVSDDKIWDYINTKKHKKLARDLDAESIVLLENHDNVLPLKKDANVAVIGPMAHGYVNVCENRPAKMNIANS